MIVTHVFSQGVGEAHMYVGAGTSLPGVTAALEPAFRASDVVEVGAKLEFSLVPVRQSNNGETNIGLIRSITGNVKFYGPTTRLYWGVGAGSYRISFDNEGFNKFGIYPRVGFTTRRFNINIDYNILSNVEDDDFAGDPWYIENKEGYSFLTIRLSTILLD